MLNEPIEESAADQKVDVACKELQLQNVSFSYEKDKQILHDINEVLNQIRLSLLLDHLVVVNQQFSH